MTKRNASAHLRYRSIFTYFAKHNSLVLPGSQEVSPAYLNKSSQDFHPDALTSHYAEYKDDASTVLLGNSFVAIQIVANKVVTGSLVRSVCKPFENTSLTVFKSWNEDNVSFIFIPVSDKEGFLRNFRELPQHEGSCISLTKSSAVSVFADVDDYVFVDNTVADEVLTGFDKPLSVGKAMSLCRQLSMKNSEPYEQQPSLLFYDGRSTVELAESMAHRMSLPGRYGVPTWFMRKGQISRYDLKNGITPLGIEQAASDVSVNFVTFQCRSKGKRWLEDRKKPTQRDLLDALRTDAMSEALSDVEGVTYNPILTPSGRIIRRGYAAETKTLCLCDETQPRALPPVKEAIARIKWLTHSMKFYTEGDRSRAIAALLSMFEQQQYLFPGTIWPVWVFRSNRSQAGKTYLAKLYTSILFKKKGWLQQNDRGVDLLQERIARILNTEPDVLLLDNTRGRLDSALWECGITANEEIDVGRQAYATKSTKCNLTRMPTIITSNGVAPTRDFVNRCCVVDLVSQGTTEFSAIYDSRVGDSLELEDYVKRYSQYFYDCLLATYSHLLRKHRGSIPMTNESRHHAGKWCRRMDYIMTEVFHMSPIMEDHNEAVRSFVEPYARFVRELMTRYLECEKTERLTSTSIVDFCSAAGIELPLSPSNDDKVNIQKLGGVFKHVFAGKDVYSDGGMVLRREKDKVLKSTVYWVER